MAARADLEPKMAFCGGLARLAGIADLSDFTITCKDKRWPVHHVVLSLHSEVLGRCCSGEFKEAKQKTYDLSEYSVEQAQALVDYMYTFDYTPPVEYTHSEVPCLHVEMCIMGDKYEISSLSKLAANKFRYAMTKLSQACDLVEATQLAYDAERATVEIRKTLVGHLLDCDILSTKGDKAKPLKEVMESYPQFAIDVYRAQRDWYESNLKKLKDLKTFRCQHCDHIGRSPSLRQDEGG